MSFVNPENAPQIYVTQMQNRLKELIAQLQEHAYGVEDEKAKDLFEKSAQVLTGLVNVYAEYAQTHTAAELDSQT